MQIKAQELLKYFTDTYFLAIVEGKNIVKYSSKEYNEIKLRQLNSDKCGIYFSVNSFGNSRKMDDCIKLNAVFGDLDISKTGDGQSENIREQKKAKLCKALEKLVCKPNFIITTKNGQQPVWLLENIEVTPENKEYCRDICNGIIHWSKMFDCLADQVKDVSRVLRIPGYFHQKEKPYFIKADKLHGEKYCIDDLNREFPYFSPKIILSEGSVQNELPDFSNLDIKDIAIAALAEAGKPGAYFDRTERITFPDGISGAFLGETGDFIGSTSHWCPHGNKITFVAKLLKISNSEAYKWIVDKFNIASGKVITPAKPQKISEIIAKRLKQREFERNAPSTGYKVLDDLIVGFIPGHLYCFTAETNAGKTALSLNFAYNLLQNNRRVLYLALEPGETVLDYLASIRLNKTFRELTDEDIKEEYPNLEILGKKEISDIKTLQATLQKENRYDVIFIDHAGYFVRNTQGAALQEHANLFKTLATIAEMNSTAIVAICHLRKPNSKTQQRTMFDISGPAGIYQDSDEILLLTRSRTDDQDVNSDFTTVGKLLILKSKSGTGANGSVILYFTHQKAIIQAENIPMLRISKDDEAEPETINEDNISEVNLV